MIIQILKSKIHRACITEIDVNYQGSLKIDPDLMEKVGIHQYERLLVANLNNGSRLETYAISGERGSKVIGLNGAAARMGVVGDRLIVLAFAGVNEEELADFGPKVIVLNEQNDVISSNA